MYLIRTFKSFMYGIIYWMLSWMWVMHTHFTCSCILVDIWGPHFLQKNPPTKVSGHGPVFYPPVFGMAIVPHRSTSADNNWTALVGNGSKVPCPREQQQQNWNPWASNLGPFDHQADAPATGPCSTWLNRHGTMNIQKYFKRDSTLPNPSRQLLKVVPTEGIKAANEKEWAKWWTQWK